MKTTLLDFVNGNANYNIAHYGNPSPIYALGQPSLEAREFTEEARKKLAKKGDAMPGGGYPIAFVQDLHNAIQAIGRAKNPSATNAHIKKRAAALGASHLIPENW